MLEFQRFNDGIVAERRDRGQEIGRVEGVTDNNALGMLGAFGNGCPNCPWR